MVDGRQTRHGPHRGHHVKPQLLHEQGHYRPHLRRWLGGKRIGVRTARKGMEPASG